MAKQRLPIESHFTMELPSIHIQPDFDVDLSAARRGTSCAPVWVSVCEPAILQGRKEHHGKLKFSSSSTDVEVVDFPESILSVKHVTNSSITLSALSHTTTFFAPTSSFSKYHADRPVSALAIAASTCLGATGSETGAIRVFDTTESSIRRDLEGHTGGVAVLKWFPSGRVLLSGGNEGAMHVWDPVDGSLACSFTPKSPSGITSLHMIGRGKHVLGTHRSGFLRLHSTPTQQEITVMRCGAETSDAALIRGEGSEGMVVVGTEKGVVGCDLRIKDPVWRIRSQNEVTAVCGDDEANQMVVGTKEGGVAMYDLRDTEEPIVGPLGRRDPYSITGLQFLSKDEEGTRALVGCADGTVGVVSGKEGQERITMDAVFVGADCARVTAVVAAGKTVWSSSVDGKVRMYRDVL